MAQRDDSRAAYGADTAHNDVNFPDRSQPGPAAQHSAEYEALLQDAYSNYNGGRYEQTVALCTRCHALQPARTDCLLLLGAAHFQMKQFDDCMRVNRKALAIDPTFAGATPSRHRAGRHPSQRPRDAP